jgi:hypothetical protein
MLDEVKLPGQLREHMQQICQKDRQVRKTKRHVDHKFTTTFHEQAQYSEMEKDMHQGAPESSRSE